MRPLHVDGSGRMKRQVSSSLSKQRNDVNSMRIMGERDAIMVVADKRFEDYFVEVYWWLWMPVSAFIGETALQRRGRRR